MLPEKKSFILENEIVMRVKMQPQICKTTSVLFHGSSD